MAPIMPRSSYSEYLPFAVGNTRTGVPACPNTSISISVPRTALCVRRYSLSMPEMIGKSLPRVKNCQFVQKSSYNGVQRTTFTQHGTVMKPFRERLHNEVIVFDGGVGTYLYEKGVYITT